MTRLIVFSLIAALAFTVAAPAMSAQAQLFGDEQAKSNNNSRDPFDRPDMEEQLEQNYLKSKVAMQDQTFLFIGIAFALFVTLAGFILLSQQPIREKASKAFEWGGDAIAQLNQNQQRDNYNQNTDRYNQNLQSTLERQAATTQQTLDSAVQRFEQVLQRFEDADTGKK